MYRVEVCLKKHLADARGESLTRDIQDLGLAKVSSVRVVDIYWLDGDLESGQPELVCRELLADPIIQDYWCGKALEPARGVNTVEVTYNAGVTDPVEQSIVKAVADLGITGLRAVKTGKCYVIEGPLDAQSLETITRRVLVNPIVEHVVEDEITTLLDKPGYQLELRHVELLETDEGSLCRLAQEFGFSGDEMSAITSYFRGENRNPTDVELETLAQTWSEHCCHKTFKGRIKLAHSEIDNLLESTIVKATRELDRAWCLSVFEDNAGVIDFDGRWAVCFKVETHNHPSAIEPYGGAATGMGGVVRDILGTGLAAKPILNTDVFCFAPPDLPDDRLPSGVLHPRSVLKGVRAGVADYGNRLGIPTANGTIRFDERYLANPLVFCGSVGIMPKQCAARGHHKSGELVVLVGGRTGRDGIHGVTFASSKLTERSTELSYSAVQIGDPIVEKKMIDALIRARDQQLFSRITDCGGGGLSSAVGEMAADTGVRVHLDKVPLKYSGLSYDEIWISEAQERMVLAVPHECLDRLLKLFAFEDVEATVIGQFTDSQALELFYQGTLVCRLDMGFLYRGRPQLQLEAAWQPVVRPGEMNEMPSDLGETLLSILGSWNVCSKEWVIRQYDYEVQGTSVLKPLVGKENDGPSDAAIIRPLQDSKAGLIVANGINQSYGDIDPYWMAASAIDEALRQVVAVGGSLERVALLDNFCWGDVSEPQSLGALVRACEACRDMSLVYGTPFISGKDSLNNEVQIGGKSVSVPHTLLVSSIAVMEDVAGKVSMDFKRVGDLVYLLGRTYRELGGSEYFATLGLVAGSVPVVRPHENKKLMATLSRAMASGIVTACHDLSEGGLGVAVAEMTIAGRVGATIRLDRVPLGEGVDRDDLVLFSESNGRFLVTIAPASRAKFERAMGEGNFALIGRVTALGRLIIHGLQGKKVVDRSIDELRTVWQEPLRW